MNLEVLGCVRIGDLDGLVDAARQHDRALAPAEGLLCARKVARRVNATQEDGLHGVGQIRAVGDEHGARHGVVLRLAEEIGGDELRGAGGVRDHRDLGGASLRVDADRAVYQALCGGHIDVARAGDDVNRIDRRAG